MTAKLPNIPAVSAALLASIESRWEKARAFFKKRGKVVFVSDRYRFWERHGFVQQSLANALVHEGVAVEWLDGAGWRPYEPTIVNTHELLSIEKLFGCRGEGWGL